MYIYDFLFCSDALFARWFYVLCVFDLFAGLCACVRGRLIEERNTASKKRKQA